MDRQPTHLAVPIEVFRSTVDILSALPFKQVSAVIQALQQCKPLAIDDNAKPGDKLLTVDGDKK